MKSDRIMEKYDRYVGRTYNTLPVVLSRGEGIYLFNMKGKRYLDFWASYSAVNFGHKHPRLTEVAKRELDKGPMRTRAIYTPELALLGEKVAKLMDMDVMIIPKNGGVESVDTAIKAMRMYAYRALKIPRHKAEIIVAENNFHGRQITIISFSSEKQYKEDFGPHTPGFKIVPYNNIRAIEEALTPYTIGVLLEPIQGEGGIRIPDKHYLNEVRELCDNERLILALDEIQTGLGRCGKTFCYQYNHIEPDILIIGKSLGGGILPISLIAGKREIMKHWKPGDDGSTFGGYAMAAAIGCEALDVLVEEKLAERSFELGKKFLSWLKEIKSPYIKEVRGRGLLCGIELFPEAGGARKFVEKLLSEEGLICKEAHKNILRFSPPLIIDEATLKEAAEKIARVLTCTCI